MGFTKRIWRMRGGDAVVPKERADYLKAREKWRETEQEAAAEPPVEERFAAKYYAGTFDEELNKLAIGNTPLWQGYYPSLYNPHTQEAAEHLPAPMLQPVDPITGQIIPEPEPEPEPEPPVETTVAGKKDPRGKKGYWRKKRLMKSGDWTQEMQEEYEWDNRFWNSTIPSTSTSTSTDPTIGSGAPRPTVNPDGTLVPWSWSNWVISMGQWRGT